LQGVNFFYPPDEIRMYFPSQGRSPNSLLRCLFTDPRTYFERASDAFFASESAEKFAFVSSASFYPSLPDGPHKVVCIAPARPPEQPMSVFVSFNSAHENIVDNFFGIAPRQGVPFIFDVRAAPLCIAANCRCMSCLVHTCAAMPSRHV
jgi:hypothetical protein